MLELKYNMSLSVQKVLKYIYKQPIFSLVTVIILVLAIYTLIQLWDSVTENTQLVIVGGIISLISALWTISYTKLKERKLQIEAANNVVKHKIYKKFTSELIDAIAFPR